jgi:glycerophosphoryl diester phosphodiesterase
MGIMAQRLVTVPSYFDTKLPIAFAHRGGNERFPENTIAAFQDAYELGYRYFETDVHYTVDHELVAFHDGSLQRNLGIKGTIATMTKADRQLKLLEGKYQIPLLSELFERFPDVYFNIDAKSQAAVEPLIATIKKHSAAGRVCLASFSASRIQLFRSLLPEAPSIATRYESAGLRFRAVLGRVSHSETRYVQIPEHFFHEKGYVKILNRRFIHHLHDGGHKVFIWTVNQPADMHRLLDMGVDGLFTDKLRTLKTVLVERGQWQ